MNRELNDLLNSFKSTTYSVSCTEQTANWIDKVIAPQSVGIIGIGASNVAGHLLQLGMHVEIILGLTSEFLARQYDLIIVIIENLSVDDNNVEQIVANLCKFSDDILLMVCPMIEGGKGVLSREKWSILFLKQGFVRDWVVDIESVMPGGMRFRRVDSNADDLLTYYEVCLEALRLENRIRRELNLEDHVMLAQTESRLLDAQRQLKALQANLQAWEMQWAELERGILWPWLQRLQKLRAQIAPPESRREQWLEHLFGRKTATEFGEQITIAPIIVRRDVSSYNNCTVSIIVKIQHDLSLIQACLSALLEHTSVPYSLQLAVNAVLDPFARRWLEGWAEEHHAQIVFDNSLLVFEDEYVVRLNTGIQVTAHWLQNLIISIEQENGVQAVAPYTDSLLPAVLQKYSSSEISEMVERFAANLVLPVSDLPDYCVLSRSKAQDLKGQMGICDAVYVKDVAVGSGIAISSFPFPAAERVWLGAQARLEVADSRIDFIRRGLADFGGRKVLFVLPVSTAGGGANIVISEALAMRAMGVEAALFNLWEYRSGFERAYSDLTLPVFYGSPRDLFVCGRRYDAVVATFNTSVQWLEPLSSWGIVRGYYLQGFEPLIYEPSSPEFETAWASYALFPDLVRFTKTEWTRHEVLREIGVDSVVVGPSLDVDLFRPRSFQDVADNSRPLRITAMVRPYSKYRAPELTMSILRETAKHYHDAIEVYLFGISATHPEFLALPRDFPWKLAGVLGPQQMAHLLAMTDIFVDFSEHQAMGLTAMEAMSCGNAVIVPQKGGAISFAKDQHNALVVDTSVKADCKDALWQLIEDSVLRDQLRVTALQDIVHFFPERAAYNILCALFTSKDSALV